MSDFFSAEPGRIQLTEFGPLHWVTLGVLALAIAVTVIFRARLRSERVRWWLPVGLGIVAWILEILYHVWTYINHLDFVFNLVPLELCAISLYLTVILCFTRNRAVWEIYYFTSVGALASVLFPAMGGFGPDHIRYWHYFICHGYIAWLNAWFLAVEGYRLRRSALVRLLAVGVPFVLVVRFVDWKWQVNYMFLQGPSATASPLDFLGPAGPAYFLKLLLLAVVVFGIMYVAAPKVPRAPALRDEA
ncbi:MAG: TIGR02206 family membrane protein [Propionibacteriaceae bacterium]|jgi:hypothetical integral membrane protein (TIGR02206 family)|nr:TIGR02206 family membrane protein [Propionibacteriaceae bacterium]